MSTQGLGPFIATLAIAAWSVGGQRAPVVTTTPVRVDSGLVSGVSGQHYSDVQIFKGIPFAAPPLGALRWKPPQTAVHWSGVRSADQFSPVCQQPPRTGFAAAVGSGVRLGASSEDCLYLNVWTNSKLNGRLPVMVWFPGGGFATGGGSALVFDGEALAHKGVVVVTTNYRLGVLGFFAHPDLTKESSQHSSGNYGLMDQIAALRWVRQNITQFGGAPNLVTIFGQSAGATSVSYLMASPQAKGLFHRVIGQSGGGTGGIFALDPTLKRPEAEEIGLRAMQLLRAKSLSELRERRADELVQSIEGTGPIIDGWIVPEDIGLIFRKGHQNDLPLLVGSNADDGGSARALPLERYIEESKTQFGPLFDAFIKLYPSGSTQEEARFLHADTQAWRVRTWARQQASTGRSRAYLYYFSRPAPSDSPGGRRAFHGAELYYVFRNLHLFSQRWEEWDQTLEEIAASFWVNFAIRGDPNGGQLPHWAHYLPAQEDQVMVLGDRVGMGRSRLDRSKVDLFDAYHTELISK